jgi:outer membrane immunogenic protein
LTTTLAAAVTVAAAIAGPMAGAATAQDGPGYYLPVWQGSYAGFHLGYGDAGAADGFVAGLHVGYNWQAGRIVYGLEADVAWSDISHSETFTLCAAAAACVSTRVQSSIDWLATVRARLGYLVQPDVLPYVTAGFGLVSGSASASIDVPGFAVSADDTDMELVYGIGLEARFGAGMLLRIEYLGFSDTEIDLIRAGLSFKLGG